MTSKGGSADLGRCSEILAKRPTGGTRDQSQPIVAVSRPIRAGGAIGRWPNFVETTHVVTLKYGEQSVLIHGIPPGPAASGH